MSEASEVPVGLCQCGCGQKTEIATKNNPQTGMVKGQPRKFVGYHGVGRPRLPRARCGCGCGERVSGTRSEFKPGHHLRLEEFSALRAQVKSGPDHPNWRRYEYTVEDRGHTSPCHISVMSVDKRSGYPHVNVDGSCTTLHRHVYEKAHGELDRWTFVDHLCSVKNCIRLGHLEAVSPAENSRRGKQTKLTKGQVRDIRASEMSAKDIAKAYGVSEGHVYTLRSWRQWNTDMEEAA